MVAMNISQKIEDSREVAQTGAIHGWAVEHEAPWWYAEKDGQSLQAYSKEALMHMIARRTLA